MKYVTTALLVLMFVVGVAPATDYVYRDGYYWYSGRAYTRTLYQYPGYWSYGVYYPGAYYYQYYEVPVVTKTETRVTYNDPGWRTKLLELAAQRDKFEGEIRKGAHEQQYFMEAVQGLGLQGNFRWNGYGAAAPYSYGGYGGYGSGYIQSYGASGSTKYGYTYNSLSQLYGDGDLSQLYQAANQLAQNAQRLGGDATAGFSALAGQEGANRARVAEIIAKGQMAQQILQALDAGPVTETRGFSFKFNQKGVLERAETGVDPKVKGDLAERWKALAESRCAACHTGANKKGGFDVSVYPTMPPEEKQKVWLRLVSEDEKRVMPRDADGHAGKRLTADEFRLWVLN